MTTPRKPTTKTAKAKKTTAKKETAKKVPAKKITKSKVVDVNAPVSTDVPFVRPMVMSASLDLFEEEDQSAGMVESMREGLDKIVAQAKTKQVSFLSPEQMAKLIIPLDELPLQNAIGSVGLRAGVLFELIAPEHVGKTTLVANWMGKFALQGCQSLYIECEGKPMDPNRFLRCMHTDRRVAERIYRLVTCSSARTLLQAEHIMNVWVKEARTRADQDPRFAGKPLIVVVDPWGKLMSESEAEGYSDFGKNAKQLAAAKTKETGKASNLGHSKYAHAWVRRLPSWLTKNNVLLIIVQHQNEHIDMGSYSPVTVSDAKNDTVIGGKAFAQLAAYRATLTSSGQWSMSDNTVIGNKLRLMFIKNSYGPKFRSADLRLKFEHHSDTPTHFDPVTYYSFGGADWLVSKGILNTRLSDKLYTCDTLGCVAVSAEDLYAALKLRPDVIKFIGTQQKIEGYAHVPLAADATGDTMEVAEEVYIDGEEVPLDPPAGLPEPAPDAPPEPLGPFDMDPPPPPPAPPNVTPFVAAESPPEVTPEQATMAR